MTDITKIIFHVPVKASELPMTDEWRANIKRDIIDHAHAVWGPDVDVILYYKFVTAPGIDPRVAVLVEFTMTKSVD